MKEQQRLENIDFRISQATTKRVLRRLRGLLYNTSNWHLTDEQYALKHKLLSNVNERIKGAVK